MQVGRRLEIGRGLVSGVQIGRGMFVGVEPRVLGRRGLVPICLHSVHREIQAQRVRHHDVLAGRQVAGAKRSGAGADFCRAILGRLGDDVDHAAHRHAAPQAGGTATHDFNVVHGGERHAEPLRRQVERVHDRDAVQQHQHLGIAQAANLGLRAGRVAQVRGRARKIEARDGAQQLVQRLRRRLLNVLLRDHRGVRRHVFQRGVVAAGRDHHLLHRGRGGAGVLGLRIQAKAADQNQADQVGEFSSFVKNANHEGVQRRYGQPQCAQAAPCG